MIRIFVYLFFVSLVSSCVTQKDVVYLQSQTLSRTNSDHLQANRTKYFLQTNDVLSVRVISPQPEISNLFNTTPIGVAGGGGGNMFSADPGNLFMQGYSIDEGGEITVPTIGKVKVDKMTVEQAQEVIQRRINEYVKNSTVLVRMVSFRVTVVGEVGRPGQFYIFNKQATIFDALALAGDVQPFGNRKEVKLIRQTPSGSDIVQVDLRDPKLLSSQYYYLAPNDAVYVEPLRAATIRNNFVLVGAVSSIFTTVILLYNFVERLQQ